MGDGGQEKKYKIIICDTGLDAQEIGTGSEEIIERISEHCIISNLKKSRFVTEIIIEANDAEIEEIKQVDKKINIKLLEADKPENFKYFDKVEDDEDLEKLSKLIKTGWTTKELEKAYANGVKFWSKNNAIESKVIGSRIKISEMFKNGSAVIALLKIK